MLIEALSKWHRQLVLVTPLAALATMLHAAILIRILAEGSYWRFRIAERAMSGFALVSLLYPSDRH